MTFLSYAQNFEDVLLWRALGHIKNGYYIDVGANDPELHSVTKAFYDAGWYGINIEPLPSFHQAFMEQRPRDVNLAIAAGARDATLTLFDVPAMNGWATTDPEVAAAHRAEGYDVEELAVPVRRLADICAEHVRGEIHFLKIDVEGAEAEVLRGMDFARWRPWVLIIEATLPNSRVTNHASWEALVTNHGYRYAYFDGLNRYYVADEHAQLLAALDIQPNVFDAFISHHLDKAWRANEKARDANQEALAQVAEHQRSRARAEERADDILRASRHTAMLTEKALAQANEAARAANARADAVERAANEDRATLSAQITQMQAEGQKLSQWAQGLERRINAVESSWSWRLTRPLRVASGLLRAVVRFPLRERLLKMLAALVRRITASERARRMLIPLLMRFPALDAKVSQAVATVKQAAVETPPQVSAVDVPEHLRALPEAARGVLADLQRTRRQPPTV